MFSKARAARGPKQRESKAELLERIERLQAARRLIDEELRVLTMQYIEPRDGLKRALAEGETT